MASSSSSLSFPPSCRNWVFDVFPSFSGEDVRKGFLSHFLEELDRKLIVTFKDNEIERSQSLGPELKKAIRTSKVAVVVFSKNYASSSWCLNELLEIVKCKKEFGQMVIPVFYGLDPSHVRKQTGDFGNIFEKTCHNKTEEETQLWRQSLTHVANILGYHSNNWQCEAKMIKAIANDVLAKLNFIPSKDFEKFVGMEDHILKMTDLLQLESEEVRMVGILGSSGIGKTTIARVLFNRLSRHFEGSVSIDRAFVSKSMEIFSSANPDDYNMKLHLQNNFLSRILGKKDIKTDCLGAIEERLKQQKVVIFIDDLDDQMVLDTLVGQNQWFGCGSSIIVITKDEQLLRAHGMDHIYKVFLPSDELALEMLCCSAFRKRYPPNSLMEFASEVALLSGNLPLGLNILGSYLRGKDKEDWMDMLPSLRSRLNGKIERILRVSYDGLNNKKDEAIFRHIACLFNGEGVKNIKELLAGSDLDVNIGIKNLVDKSLIHVFLDTVEMHCLLREMGREIVRAQSNEPVEREFLVDSKEICNILKDNIETKKVIGISLDMDEIDELHIHDNAFKGMRNLLFLKIYNTNKWVKKKEVRWHLREGFNHWPPKLRFLRLDGYPLRCLPSNFRPENLVKLQIRCSKLEKLWDGVHSLEGLKHLDLFSSKYLKEIPDLSMATNLERLDLCACSSLVELPYSIQYLHKLEVLNLTSCENLETLPTRINLQSLDMLSLQGCSRLKTFPCISTNISLLILSGTEIKKFPSNLRLENLTEFLMFRMRSVKLWDRLQVLSQEPLESATSFGCMDRMSKDQPLTPLMNMLSPSLTVLSISDIPSLVELPSSFQNFIKLEMLSIRDCINLETLPTDIHLEFIFSLDLSGCSRLRKLHNISTGISFLNLSKTGIEEVSCWIENFPCLKSLSMNGCNNLRYVSLNIFKLKSLEAVHFSDCGALTKATWNDSSSVVAMESDSIHLPTPHEASSSLLYNRAPRVLFDFFNCFNLDQEALLQQQSVFKLLDLSSKEMPLYFTHQTSGTSSLSFALLQTPLSTQSIRVRACAAVEYIYMPIFLENKVHIKVNCRLKDRLGNTFDYPYHLDSLLGSKNGSHLVVIDFCIPLNKDLAPLAEPNYNQMEVRFHFSSDDSMFKVTRWGIRLLEDCSTAENRPCIQNTLPHVCEVNDDNIGYTPLQGLVNKTEHSEESGDSNTDAERSRKQMRDGVYASSRAVHQWIRNFVERVVKRQIEVGNECGLRKRPLKKLLFCPALQTCEKHVTLNR